MLLMIMDKYISSYSAGVGVMAPDYQGILITISVIVVVAALVFAGYIFVRAEKNPTPENTLRSDINATVHLQISELEVEPLELRIGEKVTISFNATNLDNAHHHYGIIVKIDNRMFATQEISIAPGSTLPMQFAIYLTESGEHRVDVNDVVSKFVVVA
jgi:hypothetical protein